MLYLAFCPAARSPHLGASNVGASHDNSPGWHAIRCSGIGVAECHSFFAEGVDTGSFVEAGPVVADVAPAQIIGDHEYDIGLSRYE